MPTIRVSAMTMHLIRTHEPTGFHFARLATRAEDGAWDIPTDDEVAMKIARERVRGESDDGVVARAVAFGGYPWVGGSLPVRSR